MSDSRHADVRCESLTGLGYLPLRIPIHHVDLETGILCKTPGRRKKPPAGMGAAGVVLVSFVIAVPSCCVIEPYATQ